MPKRPNVVYVLSDQHRAQSIGYAGDPDVKTPQLDALNNESLCLTTAVAGIPVCTPARACLLTGQYPLTHGLFLNDLNLRPSAVSIAQVFSEAGYRTAYIGKWHLDGHGRSGCIPSQRRLGFEYWRTLECTHSYNESRYYADNDQKIRYWEGYDAEAQTACAIDYIRGRDRSCPFVLFLAWGPPHAPYSGAPEPYAGMYSPGDIGLRPNVPESAKAAARKDLAGYYAHISALDEYIGRLLAVLDEQGLAQDTIFVYTSDHGDMLGSQGNTKKQKPWDESILVPFLLRYPRLLGRAGREEPAPFDTPDIMPTLLDLAGLPIPHTVEGHSYADFFQGRGPRPAEAAVVQCISPFGQWHRGAGGKEYRGLRTDRYTYTRDLEGPWLLYDNQSDPYQLENLCGRSDWASVQSDLEEMLRSMLAERHDTFLNGDDYVKMWDYPVGETGTVPWEW